MSSETRQEEEFYNKQAAQEKFDHDIEIVRQKTFIRLKFAEETALSFVSHPDDYQGYLENWLAEILAEEK